MIDLFKLVFLNRHNRKYLRMLLENVLNTKITDIYNLGTKLYPNTIISKDKRLYCLVNTSEGIEIDTCSRNNGRRPKADTIFPFEGLSNHFKFDEAYLQNHIVIQIYLTSGFNNREKSKYIYKFQNDEHVKYVENLEIVEINLDYYHNYWVDKDIAKIKDNYLLVAFRLDEEELEELARICKESSELVDIIKEANMEYYNILNIDED